MKEITEAKVNALEIIAKLLFVEADTYGGQSIIRATVEGLPREKVVEYMGAIMMFELYPVEHHSQSMGDTLRVSGAEEVKRLKQVIACAKLLFPQERKAFDVFGNIGITPVVAIYREKEVHEDAIKYSSTFDPRDVLEDGKEYRCDVNIKSSSSTVNINSASYNAIFFELYIE